MSTVVGNLRVVLGLDSAAFQKGMADATKSLQGIGQSMRQVGTRLSLALTAPIAAFGIKAVRTAADFETAMNRVAAVSGATGAQFEALERQARDLGATTQFSASEAADAMGFLAMAGYKTDQIIGAMPDTLKLASAAQLDMASAADIVTNILSGYSMDVDELAHANDVLVKAFTGANTDLRQLGEAMKYAGPIASAAGVEFEEAAAALGMMGSAGIQGSMAGTSLRGAISRILSPTKQMRLRMQEAGLAFTDAQGRLLPLADIIEQLEPHAEDAGLMMDLFGQRAGPAMAGLVAKGSEALREFTGDLRDSGGTAERISRIQMEGFNGAIKQLQSAYEELQIAIAKAGLIGMLTDFVKWLAEAVTRLNSVNPELLKWGTALAAAAAALGPLLVGLGFMVGALSALSAPLLVAVGLVAVLGAAAIDAYRQWDKLREQFPRVTGAIEGAVPQAEVSLNRLKTAFESAVSGDYATAGQNLKAFLVDAVDGMDRLIDMMMGEGSAANARAWVDGVAAEIGRLPSTAREQIGQFATAFKTDFDRLKTDAMTWARDVVSSIGTGLGGMPQAAIDAVSSLAAAFGAEMSALADSAVSWGADIVQGIINGVKDRAAALKDTVAQMASDAASAVTGFFGIKSPSRLMMEYGRFISEGLGLGIAGASGQPVGAMQAMASETAEVMNGVRDGIKEVIKSVGQDARTLPEIIGDMVRSVLTKLAHSGIDRAIDSLFGALRFGGDPLTAALAGAGVAIPSFAGGGYTWDGPRSGGLDGRGGRMALLHPRETVIDHTRGQAEIPVRVYVDDSDQLRAMVDRRADARVRTESAQRDATFGRRYTAARKAVAERAE